MASLKASVFLLLLFFCITMKAKAISFDSIYQFGDSISDTGNLMRESNTSYCSFPPYGESLSPKPNGRCSNGLLMIDFFARAFKLPLLKPYLNKDADFSHGINFAVAGSTALDGKRYPLASTNSSLNVQLQWFKAHIKSLCNSSSECKQMFRRTLFLMGEIGGNDYNYALLGGQSMTSVFDIVPNVVQTIANAVNEVIGYGAVQVIVPGNFPIGCMPAYLTTFRSNDSTIYDDLGCLKPLNEFARFHNDHLKEAIEELKKQNPNVSIHYGDYYSGFLSILRNADSLGFDKEDVLTPCCGDVVHFCGGKGVGLCSGPKKRISWDGVHLTQAAYRNMARWLLNDIFPRSTAAPASAPAPTPYPAQRSSGGSVSVSTVLSGLALFVFGSNLM